MNPDNPGFVERLSDLLVRLGRLKEAQTELELLVESIPRDPRIWMKLGAIHYEQKHWEQAVSAFRQAVMLEPSNMRTRYFLATALMDAGKDDEARIELEKILRADPRSVDARVQLGFLFGRTKKYGEAVKVLQEAINIEPKRPELFLYLGTALQRASQYDRAASVLQEGISIDDKQKDLHFQLGVVYEKQQRLEDAVRAFRRVIAIDPKHAESYNFIGYMYAEKGVNLPEAIELIQKALALEPDNGYFIDSLGWAYYQQGRYPEALRELQRAVAPRQRRSGALRSPGRRVLEERPRVRGHLGVGALPRRRRGRDHRGRGEEEDQGHTGQSAPGSGWRAQGRAEVASGRAPSSLPHCSPQLRSAAAPRLPSAARSLPRPRRPWRVFRKGRPGSPTSARWATCASAETARPSASPACSCSGHPPRSASRRSRPSACPSSWWPVMPRA